MTARNAGNKPIVKKKTKLRVKKETLRDLALGKNDTKDVRGGLYTQEIQCTRNATGCI